MTYLTNRIIELVSLHEPDADGEAMILINGFSDLRIYEQVARILHEKYKFSPISAEFKLAGRKWAELSAVSDSTTRQSMVQNGWIADKESITYYRNLHETNILILMGTEDEEDTGGLQNCFTITPESLLAELGGDYSQVFKRCFTSELVKADMACINKMYKNLFEFAAPDIFKMSQQADRWHEGFDSTGEFIGEFFNSLPEWGLQRRVLKPVKQKEVEKTGNFLRGQYQFISRKLFQKVSKAQYRNCADKLEKYNEEDKTYSNVWDGWPEQGFHSYDEFAETLLEFIRGENIQSNSTKLLGVDYTIIDEILNIKLPKTAKTLVKDYSVTGDPLKAFLSAAFHIMQEGKGFGVSELAEVRFEFDHAEVVTGYTDADDREKQEQLISTWSNICIHTDGIFSFIDTPNWSYNGGSLSIVCANPNFFSIDSINNNINSIVKTASATNTLNKVYFAVRGVDVDGNVVTYLPKGTDKDDALERQFCWKFSSDEAWLYDFAGITQQDFAKCDGGCVLPVGILNKIRSTLGFKGKDEFFNFYDDAEVDYSFDLIKYIKDRTSNLKPGSDILLFKVMFEDVAQYFCAVIRNIAKRGFYSCIGGGDMRSFFKSYNDLAQKILTTAFPENQLWILSTFIHAFNIEEGTDFLDEEVNPECCIVPPWHPAALQKLCDQKRFVIDGIKDAWLSADTFGKKFKFDDVMAELYRMTEIQSAVDLFPAEGTDYYGIVGAYGTFSVYGNSNHMPDVKVRVRDLIKKEAIYDDEFNKNELIRMNDDAVMIFDVLCDYIRAIPSAKYSMSLVFVNPVDLQPIIAAVYHYTNILRKDHPNQVINIKISMLVRPENKGGRNYLAYWMDDYFAQESNTHIKTYLNEWSSQNELNRLLNDNNDIIFNMDLMRVNTFSFIADNESYTLASDCRFPIVYKPSPLSKTSKKRKIELSQPQFTAAFNHTQVVRYLKNSETIPATKYIAVSESRLEKETQAIINLLHRKSYWVVCVDRVMDGALLRGDSGTEYSIIGFSTGKGTYGQYNLTITARKSILETVQRRLTDRLRQLFHWKQAAIGAVVERIINEASTLDGISLLSAINQRDYNINEFMAYVLTSLRERDKTSDCALRIIVHLDSYRHWFANEDAPSKRPDFLMLSVLPSDDILRLRATVIECKISSYRNSTGHIEDAKVQVRHGLEQLQRIFAPDSESIERRYWFSQLYRALVFAQVTFSNNSDEFESLSAKLRSVLDGKFSIEWAGEILGYWFDMPGTNEVVTTDSNGITICNIPQIQIQKILSATHNEVSFIDIPEDTISTEEKDDDSEIEDLERKNQIELQDLNARGRVEQPVPKKRDDTPSDPPHIASKLAEKDADISQSEMPGEKPPKSTPPLGVIQTDKPTLPEQPSTISLQPESSLETSRISIGKDRKGNEVFWEFGNTQLANRHLLITGTSGQGKTYSIQTMLYEASKANIAAVIFDYTEGFRKDQLEKKFLDKMEDRIDDRVVYFTGVPVNPFKRNEIEVAGMRAPEKIADVAQRIANILTHVYSFGEQQFAAIFDACRVGLEKHGDSMNMKLLEQELIASSNKSAKLVVSKMAPFFHSVEFTNEEFDWKDVLYGHEGQVTIFQLTNFVRDIQVIITEFLLWDMWHYTRKYGNKDKPFIVVLDEAQNLSHTLTSPSGMILTEGRKFGWSAWYATQSLKILSDDEIIRLMQSAFKLYFKPTDDEVVAMAKQLNPTDHNEWKTPLTNLKKGQCIVVGSRIQSDGKFGSGRPTITSVTPFEERK